MIPRHALNVKLNIFVDTSHREHEVQVVRAVEIRLEFVMEAPDVAEVMARYSAGLIDSAQAASEIAPAYAAAEAARAQRGQTNSRTASTYTPFAEVSVARWSGVITIDQLVEVIDELRAMQSTSTSDKFDLITARAGLTLLRRARERYIDAEAEEMHDRPNGDAQRADWELRMYGHAAEALIWARSLDDWCTGRSDGGPKLQDYLSARADSKSDDALLRGARYAANKSLHIYASLTSRVPGRPFVLNEVHDPTLPPRYGRAMWTDDPLRLPPLDQQRISSERLDRKAYLSRIGGRAVFETLDELEDWFSSWLDSPTSPALP
jgi:hypothetical protein